MCKWKPYLASRVAPIVVVIEINPKNTVKLDFFFPITQRFSLQIRHTCLNVKIKALNILSVREVLLLVVSHPFGVQDVQVENPVAADC